MTTKQLSKEIFKRYGEVTRARGYFLYTKKGVRLTDMYLEDGRAVLGWRAGNALLHFKNFLSRGITGSFMCEKNCRLEKAVSLLLDGSEKSVTRRVFVFSAKSTAVKASLMFSKDKTMVWKPFSKIDYSNFDSVVIAPPFGWTDSFWLVAVKTSACDQEIENLLPEETVLSFPLKVAVARGIYDYIEEEKVRVEKGWFIYDTYLHNYFERNGCHLTPKVPKEKYDEFVLYCLDNQIVINPHYDGTSYVPYQVDKGNFTKIKNSPFAF